jgi:hypothetical protein
MEAQVNRRLSDEFPTQESFYASLPEREDAGIDSTYSERGRIFWHCVGVFLIFASAGCVISAVILAVHHR